MVDLVVPTSHYLNQYTGSKYVNGKDHLGAPPSPRRPTSPSPARRETLTPGSLLRCTLFHQPGVCVCSGCVFGTVKQELQVTVAPAASGCTLWPGAGFRLVNLSTDGRYVDAVRLNCSDSLCQHCEYAVDAVTFPVGECMPLKGSDTLGSVLVYPMDEGICLASLAGRPDDHGLYSAEYNFSDSCANPTVAKNFAVTLRHWGQKTTVPQCLQEDFGGDYASLVLSGGGSVGATTQVSGVLGCPTNSCTPVSCSAAVNAAVIGRCSRLNTTAKGNSSIVFQSVAALTGCRPAAPSGSDPRPLNYPLVVIGSTLGAFALIWLIVSTIYCKQRPARTVNMQGEEAASPLFSGVDLNTSYSSIDG